MNAKYTTRRWLVLSTTIVFALALSACGGGGEGSSGGGTTPPPTNYLVSSIAGQGGSISPASLSVTSGQTTSFTLIANTGYRIAGATGCNGNLAGNLYTTGTITADCAVTASFAAQTIYSVSTRQNAGGSISPSSASVVEGTTTRFTITPDTGYAIASATGCGGTLEGNNFTTAPMTANCVVDVNFEPQKFTISTEVTGPGGIWPTSATVSYGQDAMFNQIYVPGYSVEILPGCNARWDAEGIKAPFVTENCTLRIKFVPIDYEITTKVEGSGSISPSKVSARYGDELRFNILPGEGQVFSYSKGCDGYFDSKTSVFIVPSVTGSCQLQVSFHDERYVYFADPLLEQKVRETLAIPPNQLILPSDMEKLKYLSAASANIKQLDGLEYAKNLRTLSLEYNQITSLRPLANLKLEFLSISGNPITSQNLTFLPRSSLATLFMDSTKVTDISSLASQTQLNYLSIQYTQITDLSPLQNMTQLQVLQAMYSSVADISPLLSPGLKQLTNISLGGCLQTKGFSRALPIVETLREKGATVALVDPGTWSDQKCPYNSAIKNVLLSGNLGNGELELNWQVMTDDQGPWQCELHFNLDSQLPRLPTKVIENCHTQTSIRLPGFNLNEYSPSLRVDTGIYNGHMTSAPASIVSANRPQTASLHSYDWAQTVLKTNPLLVVGKDASLRLHVTAQSISPVPTVEVYAELAGQREAVPVTPPIALPTSKRHGERNQSFHSQIPARLMQPGLKLEVFLAGNKQLTLIPQFSKIRGIRLQLVPLQADGLVSTLPEDAMVRSSLTRFWPLSDIQISHRAPYQLSKPIGKNTTSSMLYELADLRVVENGTSYYYGYFDPKLNSDTFGGIAFSPGEVGVGLNNLKEVDTILAHEIGHNFSLLHAPCGFPEQLDNEYPYTRGSIGSYGTDLGYTTIFNPTLKDVMGYCGADHVSDYNYEKAQDYLSEQAGQPFIINAANTRVAASAHKPSSTTSTSSLYLRIAVNAIGASVAQQIALPHLPSLQGNSNYRAQVEFADGSQQELPVALLQLGHGGAPGEYQLQLAIPTHEQQPVRLTLLEGQKPLLQHLLNTNTSKSTTASSAKTSSGNPAAQSQLQYRNNEICVAQGAKPRRVNLLWRHANGVIALALNETDSNFCRTLGNLPAGEAELQVF